MGIRNPFEDYDFGDAYAPRPRKNYFSGSPQDPVAARTREMLGQAGTFEFDSPQAGPPQQSQPESVWGNWMNEMRDMYTKEGPASAAYREHLNAIPQYTTPSKWQKFGAALTGASEGLRAGGAAGWNAGQEAAQAPYKRELQQWGLKEKGLGQQMSQEEKMMGRRADYLNLQRQFAKDDEATRRWTKEQEFARQKEDADEAHRELERQRWGRQDLETYTDDQGNLRERMPGSTGPGRLVGPSEQARTFRNEDTRLGYQARTTAATESNAANARAQTGIARDNYNLAVTREDRIQNEYMAPGQISSGDRSALQRAVVKNPAYAGFVSEEGNVIPPTNEDPNSAKWQTFQKFLEEVRREREGIFSTPRHPPIYEYDSSPDPVIEYDSTPSAFTPERTKKVPGLKGVRF